jgi:hypothetical protein
LKFIIGILIEGMGVKGLWDLLSLAVEH